MKVSISRHEECRRLRRLLSCTLGNARHAYMRSVCAKCKYADGDQSGGVVPRVMWTSQNASRCIYERVSVKIYSVWPFVLTSSLAHASFILESCLLLSLHLDLTSAWFAGPVKGRLKTAANGKLDCGRTGTFLIVRHESDHRVCSLIHRSTNLWHEN